MSTNNNKGQIYLDEPQLPLKVDPKTFGCFIAHTIGMQLLLLLDMIWIQIIVKEIENKSTS